MIPSRRRVWAKALRESLVDPETWVILAVSSLSWRRRGEL